MGHYSQSSVTAGWTAALHFLHLSAQASLPTDVPSPSLKWLSSPLALPPPCGGVVLGREAWTLSPGGWGSSLGSATDGQVTLGFVSVFVKDGPSWEGEPSPGALRTVPGSSWVAAVVAAPVLLPTPLGDDSELFAVVAVPQHPLPLCSVSSGGPASSLPATPQPSGPVQHLPKGGSQ